MDDFHHNRYFKDIGYQTDTQFRWPKDEDSVISTTIKSEYDTAMVDLIKGGTIVSSLTQLHVPNGREDEPPLVLWFNVDSKSRQQPFKPIGEYFKIWHEIERGDYNGVHTLIYEGRRVVIVNERDCKPEIRSLMAHGGKVWGGNEFR
jgi:hypothetical protein